MSKGFRTVYLKDKKISNLEELKSLLSENPTNETKIIRYFYNNLNVNWEIYIKPYLNGLQPDMILMREDTGIITIRFDKENPTGIGPENHLELIQREIRTVLCPSCYDSFLKDWPPEVGEYEKKLFLPVITSCIISTEQNSSEMEEKYEKFADKSITAKDYHRLISKDDLQIKDVKKNIPFLQYDGRSTKMNSQIYKELKFWLMPYESMFEESNYFSLATMQPLALDKTQEQLTKERTASGFRKIKGPAGSGKTNILSFRALNCSLESKSVLFLTQNRSLIPYLMNCIFRAIKSKKEEFLISKDRGSIRYDHFYSFAYKISKLLDWQNIEGELRNVSNFLENNDEFSRVEVGDEMLRDIQAKKLTNPKLFEKLSFDVILVDEFQDWLKHEWLIAKEFLKEGGEMVAAGDATQDVLGTDAKTNFDEPHALQGYGLPSRWRELQTSYRLPYDYVPLMESFLKEFLPEKGVMIPENRQRDAFTETYVDWIMVRDEKESLDQIIFEIEHFKSEEDISNLLFLADSNMSGYIVLSELINRRTLREDEITHTFPYHGPKLSNIDFRKAHKGIFTKNGMKDKNSGRFYSIYNEEARIRNRSGFFVQRNTLKASTIRNFKGLEAKNIIFQINKKNDDETNEEYFTEVYTGLSRLASVADLDESKGQYFSGIKVICSEPMFGEYSKTWKNFAKKEIVPDF